MDSTQDNSAQSVKFRRIRRMIITRVLIAPFLIVMLVFGILVYFFSETLDRRAQGELSRVAQGHRALVDAFLSEQVSALEYTAATHSFKELGDNAHLDALFLDLKSKYPAFEDIGVIDEGGRHMAYVGPYDLVGKDYSKAEWFQAVSLKSVYISDVFRGYRNVPHFVIAVQRIQGGRPWYLRATIDTAYFSNLVKGIHIGGTGQAYLVNSKGLFQTELRTGGQLEQPDPDRKLYAVAGTDIASFTARAADRQTYMYAAGRLRENGWMLVVRQKASEAYAPLVRAVAVALIVISLGGGVVVLTAYVLASSLAGRLAVMEVEKREMGSKLLAAGKLAEVGEMSAGMAHEINNPLQVMVSECCMINDIFSDLKLPEKNLSAADLASVRDCLDQVSLQISRCSNITQGLLKFARKSEPSICDVDLRATLHGVQAMIENRAHLDGVAVTIQMQDGIPLIQSDESQLEQVFLNLFNNALYAVRDRDQAEIRVSASLDSDDAIVTVADNGCGIGPDNLNKVFLPFYTTKPVGQGTGLGLSTCYGIVERLGGRMAVESELGVGTVFTVRLPLSAASTRSGA
jgi:two-component system NtrC family sensor kinase